LLVLPKKLVKKVLSRPSIHSNLLLGETQKVTVPSLNLNALFSSKDGQKDLTFSSTTRRQRELSLKSNASLSIPRVVKATLKNTSEALSSRNLNITDRSGGADTQRSTAST
jgi:hypothetical protein